MVYFRGHPLDYDDWAAAGAAGWSFREVLPYFLRTEHNEDFGGSPLHGRGGEMNVRTVTHPNPLDDAFLEAVAAQGFARRDDLCGLDTEGAALRQLSIRGGRRETSARALLRPALSRPNLTVMTGSRALHVVLDGRRARGVAMRDVDGTRRVVNARREVVLCAGAIQTPQLLLLSGIGPGDELAALGLPVVLDLPGVGRNLHDHLASPVFASMAGAQSYGLSWRALARSLGNVAQYALLRSGPLANNIFEAAAFVRSRPGLDRPDVQLVFQPAKRPSPRFPFPVGHGCAISPVGLYPRSRGRLTLASRDPLAAPHIDPGLLSDPADLEPLRRGLALARRVLADAAFRRYGVTETAPGPSVLTSEQLADYIRREAYTVHHPVSTCRMGAPDDAAAVVDPLLRVRGLAGLRIADASVFPSIIGGNTNAAVVMVAEKAADLLRGRPAPPAVALQSPANGTGAGPA
jgi:choline dehydrogenase